MAKEEGPRSFARFLEQVSDGEVHTEASREFHELTKALEKEADSRGKATGTITLKLTVSLDNRGKADIKYDVSTKEPQPQRGSGVAWLTPGGNFVFQNPQQMRLPLAEVPSAGRHLADEEGTARAVAGD